MKNPKDITYTNKTFEDFNDSFLEYVKTYFPDSYTDFSDASVGKIFMDLASTIGENLSFYQDYQFNELLLSNSKDSKNVFAIAYQLGYKPKISYPSFVKITASQQVPSKIVNNVYQPDMDYALIVKEGTVVSSLSRGKNFLIKDLVDFSINTPNERMEISVFEKDSNGNPKFYLLEKEVNAVSGSVRSFNFSVGSPQKFLNIDLVDESIIEILSVKDSEGNDYFEVDNLSQDYVFNDVVNTIENNPSANDRNQTPYLLTLKRVPRRFVARFKNNETLRLEFGSGTNNVSDEEIIPNPNNIGLNTFDSLTTFDKSYDITTFLNTGSYGVSPRNTTLTINYLVGGGIESNVEANVIDNISKVDVIQNPFVDSDLADFCLNSLAVNNYEPATGGKNSDSLEEVKINAISSYTLQNRVVSSQDYISRVLSMPSKYGDVSKVFVEKNKGFVNLYCLGYDSNKNLVNLGKTSKENLKTYLSKYNILGSKIIINDCFVINFKCFYDIVVSPSFNSNDVLLECNNKLVEFFEIDNWQINQPIIISDIQSLLSNVRGVQNVSRVELKNVQGGEYSEFSYDLTSANSKNVIYPSRDIMIFECKNPLKNILGRVVDY